MYKVIAKFRDLTDGHLYEAGDRFPHDGREIGEERLAALETDRNGAKKPLIARVAEAVAEAPETVEPEPAQKPRKARKKA